MSLPERIAMPMSGYARGVALAALLAALAATSACTVRPLYKTPAAAGQQVGEVAFLSSIAIKPAESRFEQEVRNHLIFLFSGGSGEPADPRFSLALEVSSRVQSGAVRQVADEDEPTAGTVILAASYVLTRVGTGEVVSTGQRQVAAAFDRPRQQFAAARAERDAQNRAARELAELIRLAIAQDPQTPGSS